MPHAIRARDVTFRYAGKDERDALVGCSFHVREGEVYGVLGPNGAGKTTLLRLLGTLLVPTSGELEILGHAIPGGEREVRARLGIAVGEYERTFDFRLSGEENLRYYSAFFPALAGRAGRERAREVLAEVELADAARKPYSAYSQGMKHRLALARALLARPRVLLLDEPTAGVDVATSRAFFDLVRKLAREDRAAVVYTTHRLEEAGELCDRLLILREGRGVAEDAPDELRRFSKGSDVLEIATDPPADAALLRALAALPGVAHVLPTTTGAARVHYAPGTDAPYAAFELLKREGRKLRDVKRDAPSIEDAFLRLTGGEASA